MFDSLFERHVAKAIADLLPGHYKLPFVERLSPRQRAYGPGRIFIADLTKRDVLAMVADGKAEETLDEDRFRIENRIATIGRLVNEKAVSIHAGGESLSHTMALANFQPLTPTHGIRLHNADLVKAMDYLEPRLRCMQTVVLTVC